MFPLSAEGQHTGSGKFRYSIRALILFLTRYSQPLTLIDFETPTTPPP
jgi:hypothetical protein